MLSACFVPPPFVTINPSCMLKEVESLSLEVVPEVDPEADQPPFVPPGQLPRTGVPAEASLVTCLVTLVKSSVVNVLLRGSVVIVLLTALRILLDLSYTVLA